MGIGKFNKLIAITDDVSSLTDAKDIRVKDMIMTDLSMSKVFFVDRSNKEKMLISFTIKDTNSDNISQISVTYRHIMMKVREDSLVSSSHSRELMDSHTPTSDQENQIPEMLPFTIVEAKELRVGDLLPRWAGGSGIIITRETVVGKSVQIMTENGLLMLDKNILTCYVAPYSFCYYASQPVSFLSGISHYLVKKPFYALPKKLYKRFLLN